MWKAFMEKKKVMGIFSDVSEIGRVVERRWR